MLTFFVSYILANNKFLYFSHKSLRSIFLEDVFDHISFVGLINGHHGVFLRCEIYTLIRVDSSHCLKSKFIYFLDRKRASTNVGRGIMFEDSHM